MSAERPGRRVGRTRPFRRLAVRDLQEVLHGLYVHRGTRWPDPLRRKMDGDGHVSSHSGSLHRLGIHYARTRLRISPEAYSQTMAQGSVQPLPSTVDAPNSEVVMDSLPGRKLVRQQAPGTSATDDVEDGVEDLAQGVTPGPPGFSWSRQVRLYALPLGIGEVGWVCLSHAC